MTGAQKADDIDNNGALGGSDSNLTNWTVYIDANNNGVLDTGESRVVTDASGNYQFTGLAAGSYVVREVLQSGWSQTTASSITVVASGTSSFGGNNFGNSPATTITGVSTADLYYVRLQGSTIQVFNTNPASGNPAVALR